MFATDSFATCSAGYYEKNIIFPTSSGDSRGYYSHDGNNKLDYTSPAISAGEWRVTWNNDGIAIGEASCNNTNGTENSSSGSSSSMSKNTSGSYCWCKITKWIPDGGSDIDLSAAWVFYHVHNNSDKCLNQCAFNCGNLVKDRAVFRAEVFSSATPPTACGACPNGGASVAGATAITQCYVPATTNFTDSKGTYYFTNDCYYSN